MSLHLERDLHKLKKDLLTVSGLVETALQQAMQAIHQRDTRLATAVQDQDDAINTWEVRIEEECLNALALHQPVARDLRIIASIMKINNDLERIGDTAVNIAGRVEALAAVPEIVVPPQLIAMTECASQMVRESIDAFVNSDAATAQAVRAMDDRVDQANREIIQWVKAQLRASPEHVEPFLSLFSVSRHLERVADLATNIAEDVVYMVEGGIVRHRAPV